VSRDAKLISLLSDWMLGPGGEIAPRNSRGGGADFTRKDSLHDNTQIHMYAHILINLFRCMLILI